MNHSGSLGLAHSLNGTFLSPGESNFNNSNENEISQGQNPPFFRFLKEVVVPIICVFGLVGNMLILLILTRKRLKSSCDGTERTVHIGLTALAVSDFMFCLVVLPHGLFRKEPFEFKTLSFQLLYRAYGAGLINTFLLTSTWLTVTMATSRYLAICHPVPRAPRHWQDRHQGLDNPRFRHLHFL